MENLTYEQCLEVFKKYDPLCYKLYSENPEFFNSNVVESAKYYLELHAPCDDVYVVVFDSAGYMGSVTITDKERAQSMARQLRSGGRKVRCMDREKFLALQEEEQRQRKEEKRLNWEAFASV